MAPFHSRLNHQISLNSLHSIEIDWFHGIVRYIHSIIHEMPLNQFHSIHWFNCAFHWNELNSFASFSHFALVPFKLISIHQFTSCNWMNELSGTHCFIPLIHSAPHSLCSFLASFINYIQFIGVVTLSIRSITFLSLTFTTFH